MNDEDTIKAPFVQPARATWNFSTDAFLQACEWYPQETKETMLAARGWCIDHKHPVTRDEFARRVGYDQTTIYKFYFNKYLHPETKAPQLPPEKFLKAAQQFLALERERFEGGETEFVMTPTAKKVWGFCDLARESQSMALLFGPSHVGKTWAAEHYTQSHNHGRTIYARMHAASGLGGMVRLIASACGISDKSNTEDLIERIKRALTGDTLLVLDEMHLLANTYRTGSFFSCVEVIREIYDATHCGMVLIWTRIDTLKKHSQVELQQVWRRGVHKRPLPDYPTRGDVEAISTHAGLEWPDKAAAVQIGKRSEVILEMLRQVSKAEGLKAVTERIRYGRKLATRAGEKLDWRHVVRAHLMIVDQASVQTGGWDE
jgi:DNA transposition AAA+ family ATPase